ncbi:MAG: diadenylate cyclase CdaA [Verrucomicrobia bacterium]|nr:diadenylate cyclase CdaA [Verrucomicrobiota bacterium]
MNPLQRFLTQFQIDWRDGVEILLIAVVIYHGYVYFRATRAARILTGLTFFLIGLTLLAIALELDVIEWMLRSISVFLAVSLVVIFQPELRRGLAQLGSHPWFSAFTGPPEATAESLIEIAIILSKRRFGALIAIERSISLEPYLDTGVVLDCRLSPEIMLAIFQPKSALHDGGVVFRMSDERVLGAGCVFPVSHRELTDRSIGLRHRAAIGITEESDAIAIVVSEETGQLSLAEDGRLERNLEENQFRKKLYDYFSPPPGGTEKAIEEKSRDLDDPDPGLESEAR